MPATQPSPPLFAPATETPADGAAESYTGETKNQHAEEHMTTSAQA